MNLRPSSDPSLARVWPVVAESVDRGREALRQAPTAVKRIASLTIGGATLVERYPGALIADAQAITGGSYRAFPKGDSAWVVERTA